MLVKNYDYKSKHTTEKANSTLSLGIRSILVTPCTGNNDYEILSRHGMWTMYLQGLHKVSHAWQLAVFLITS